MERMLKCELLEMFTFVMYRSDSFALKIADSDMLPQLSMSSTVSSLVIFTICRKCLVEIVVPRKLILFNLEKHLNGTLRCCDPVLAKVISSHLANALCIVEETRPRNTNCHHEKHTADTLTNRGTQRQFSENICSEDDLRSRISEHFWVKFLLVYLS